MRVPGTVVDQATKPRGVGDLRFCDWMLPYANDDPLILVAPCPPWVPQLTPHPKGWRSCRFFDSLNTRGQQFLFDDFY
jgi:hypothetical protein